MLAIQGNSYLMLSRSRGRTEDELLGRELRCAVWERDPSGPLTGHAGPSAGAEQVKWPRWTIELPVTVKS